MFVLYYTQLGMAKTVITGRDTYINMYNVYVYI